jgi:uncharacterized protein
VRSWYLLTLALIACESQGRAPKRAGAVASPPQPTAAAPAPAPAPAAAADVTAEGYQGPKLPRARVTVLDAYGYKHAVDAEVAATREARTRGLMWRTSLPEGTGMLFIFPEEDWLNFWMKNTLIPLDMIFLSKDLTIVGIIERAEPKTLAARGPRAMAKYVLEVPGGWSARMGLKPGLRMLVEGTQGIVPTD